MSRGAHLGRGLRVAGRVLLVLSIALVAMWLSGRWTDRHGALFLLGGGIFFALTGTTVWTIGYSLSMPKGSRE